MRYGDTSLLEAIASKDRDGFTLRTYQTLAGVGAAVLVAVGISQNIVRPEVTDPIWLRIVAALLLVGFIPLSACSKYIRDHIANVVCVYFFAITGYVFTLAFVNNFALNHVIGLLVAFVTISAVIRDRRRLLVYHIVTATFVIISTWMSEAPETPPLLVTVIVVAMAFTLSIVLGARRNLEGQLALSEARFRSLAEDSREVITVLNGEGVILFDSPSVMTVLGYGQRERVGRNAGEFLHECEHENARATLRSILNANGEEQQFEAQVVNKSGVCRTLSCRARASDGAVTINATDVTQLRMAGAALAESERRYRLIAEQTGQIIFQWDMQTDSITWTGATEAVTGYGPGEFSRFDFAEWKERVHPDDLPAALESIRFATEEGGRYGARYRFRCRDGSYAIIDAEGAIIRTFGGSRQMIGVMKDVTQRVHAEEVLHRKLRIERTVSAIASRFIGGMDIDAGIQRALTEIGGATGADRTYVFMLSENGESMDNTHEWCADGVEPQKDALQGIATGSLPWWMSNLRTREAIHIAEVSRLPAEASAEKQILESQGVKSLAAFPLTDGGRLIGFVGLDNIRNAGGWGDQDIFLLNMFAVVLGKAIEHDMAEKEEDRLFEQLVQVQKMEAVGTLAGGIAHDFNNLLTGILGYANMLKLSAEPGTEVHAAADVIETAGRRAADLTRQLLGFARKGRLQVRPVDMREMVGETVSILNRTMDRRIVISQRFDADTPLAVGDPGQIQQVVMNLAVNARDAMPDGGEISLETYRVVVTAADNPAGVALDPGRYVALRITDTGMGIPADVRERIFEPFFTTKPRGQGTGMGLAMSYGIMRNHHGAIAVDSEVGKGTSFVIFLPVAETAEPLGAEEPAPKLKAGDGIVLVVDDEDAVRKVLVKMLAKLGFKTVEAVNGRAALECYSSMPEKPKLVILDMTMPVMNGRDCFMALKEIDPEARVVLSTGYAMEGAAQDLMDSGVIGFIQKPYTIGDLSRTLREALVV